MLCGLKVLTRDKVLKFYKDKNLLAPFKLNSNEFMRLYRKVNSLFV